MDARNASAGIRRGCREIRRGLDSCAARSSIRRGGASARRRVAAFLDGDGVDPMAVELEEVVCGGDQPPFRATGGSSAALEAADLAVELQLAEDRLDRRLAPSVKQGGLRDGVVRCQVVR